MSKLNFAILVCAVLAAVGTSTRAHAQQPVSPYFFGLSMTGGEIGAEPWPVVSFAGMRLWDSGVAWSQLNPAPGVYDWRGLDIWMNHAKQNGEDITYTFGRVPAWITSAPEDKYCANEPGSCDPPRDLRPDGSGTDQAWRDFVTAIAVHSAGRIHYWELWDEFPNPERWHWHTCITTKGKKVCAGNADAIELVRMAQDAYTIIKAVDPTAVVVGASGALRFDNPGNVGDLARWQYWAEAGAGKYADVVAYHGYVQPNGIGAPIAETEVGLLIGAPNYPFGTGGLASFLEQYNLTQPIWDTEGGWASTAAGLKDPTEQAGFLARFYALQLSPYLDANNNMFGPVQRFDWYEWDNQFVGALWNWITRWDLAVPNSKGSVSTMVSYGDGSFQFPTNHGAGATPTAAAVGDFNNDQEVDLVVANKGGNNITVMLDSEQNPGTLLAGMNSPAGASPVAVAVGDFNKDGNLDVVVANSTANTVSVLLGLGNGKFESPVSYPVGNNPSAVAVADFDNDGYPDIAVTNEGDGTVTVLLNNGAQGGFTATGPYTVGTSPSSIAVGDFNADTYPDLAIANSGSANVTVLLNNTAGGFAPASYSPLAVGNGPSAIAVGSYSVAQLADLAVANETDSTATVLLNQGKAGGFKPAPGSPYPVGMQPVAVAAYDFNGDGHLDLATANSGDGTITTLLHCAGNPKDDPNCKTSTFDPGMTQITQVGSNPVAMAVGAFDVVGSRDPGTLYKAAYAFENIQQWFVGNTFSTPCSGPIPVLNPGGSQGNAQGVWTCGITGPGGFNGQLVWYMDQTYKTGCQHNQCVPVNYPVPAGFTQYQTTLGQTFTVPQNGMVTIGYLPILLENGMAPNRELKTK